ncbi:MAG: DUF3870 domain-containing protein [Synergistaceae bacterium]|nr:DUF3870 domain-containing protein [Synergistaceae bacterium]
MRFEKLCIVGNARTQQKNPITARFSHFFIVFIVEAATGKIVDLDVTVMLPATSNFIRELFIGRSLAEVDSELLECIRCCYLASSQKAIQMAYMEAVRKYRSWLSSHRGASAPGAENLPLS